MSYPVFYSYKPYLQIVRKNGLSVTFDENCTYTPKCKREWQRLKRYSQATENSYIISDTMPLGELQRRHKDHEDLLISEAEERAAAQAEEAKRRREDHEFFSILRASDTCYR